MEKSPHSYKHSDRKRSETPIQIQTYKKGHPTYCKATFKGAEHRNKQSFIERSNRTNRLSIKGFQLQNILSKTKEKISADNRPSEFEQILKHSLLQDDNPQVSKRKPHEGNMGNVLRHIGRISAHSHRKVSSKISNFSTHEQNLPVQSSPFRSSNKSILLYQDLQANPEKTKKYEHQNDGILRRLDRLGQHRGGMQEAPQHDNSTTRRTRLAVEHGKISHKAYTTHKVVGLNLGPGIRKDCSTPRKEQGNPRHSEELRKQQSYHTKTDGKFLGKAKLCKQCYSLGKAHDQSNILLDGGQHRDCNKRHARSDNGSTRPTLTTLETDRTCQTGSIIHKETQNKFGNDRCIQTRIRSSLEGSNFARTMVPTAKEPTYQHSRTVNSPEGINCMGQGMVQFRGKILIRQHDSGSMLKETRIPSVPSPSRNSQEDQPDSNILQLRHFSGIHSRHNERESGCTIQKECNSRGMEIRHEIISEHQQKIWPSGDRLMCHSRQQTTAEIHFPISSRTSSSPEHTGNGLGEVGEEIHLPPNETNSHIASSSTEVRNFNNFNCSIMADTGPPHSIIKHLQQTREDKGVQTIPDSKRKGGSTSTTRVLQLTRVELLQWKLGKELGEEIARIIPLRFSNSSILLYENYWNYFKQYVANNIPCIINKKFVLNYLLYLFHKPLAPNTIMVHKAALSDPLNYCFNISTSDKEFKDLIMYFRKVRPIKKKLPPQWKVSLVLKYLKSPLFLQNNSISLSCLFMKCIFLIALASGSRVSEISALRRDINHLRFHQDGSLELIPHTNFRYKSERILKKAKPILIPRLKEGKGICPVEALRSYLTRTNSWANPDEVLWLNPCTKKVAAKRTLSFRFKSLIKLSHQHDTQANFHEIRALATSLAFDKGISMKDLCSRAHWNNESVFFSSYYKPQECRTKCVTLGKIINKK